MIKRRLCANLSLNHPTTKVGCFRVPVIWLWNDSLELRDPVTLAVRLTGLTLRERNPTLDAWLPREEQYFNVSEPHGALIFKGTDARFFTIDAQSGNIVLADLSRLENVMWRINGRRWVYVRSTAGLVSILQPDLQTPDQCIPDQNRDSLGKKSPWALARLGRDGKTIWRESTGLVELSQIADADEQIILYGYATYAEPTRERQVLMVWLDTATGKRWQVAIEPLAGD